MLKLPVLLSLTSILVCFPAQSQQQSLDKGIGSQSEAQSRKASQPTPGCKRGTENCPEVVRLLMPPKTEAEALEEAKQEKEKIDLERRLVDFNGDLAYYTKILAWVAALQLLALCAQAVFLRLAFSGTCQ